MSALVLQVCCESSSKGRKWPRDRAGGKAIFVHVVRQHARAKGVSKSCGCRKRLEGGRGGSGAGIVAEIDSVAMRRKRVDEYIWNQ